MPEKPFPPLTIGLRLRVIMRLLWSLRRHDFRAARTFMAMSFPDDRPVKRLAKFLGWALFQMTSAIPDAMRHTRFAGEVSKVPVWLKDGNPLENHPWSSQPEAKLPHTADTVVIGCGLGGCAVTYHWGRAAPPDRKLVALDMGDVATGSAGRNEGLVVMGRYYHMVTQTVLPYLEAVRTDLTVEQQAQLAHQFAAHYAHACYRNADMVEQTVRDEGFQCDYAREGWVQARDEDEQASLAESVKVAFATGYTDWTCITPEEVKRRTGMNVRHNAGFSVAAASFHPAQWCWSLMKRALESGRVEHYSRTRVLGIDDTGGEYLIRTDRGDMRARHVVLCTESYTPLLMPQFHDLIRPTQTQAASGPGGPAAMKPHVGISNNRGFFGRHGNETMIGSDATRVPDGEAGRIQPSRFLTHYLCAELQKAFGRAAYTITHEWSGTVTYTPDEYPVVGVFDGRRQYILGGMAGSGTAVSFNGGRCLVNRILGNTSEPDDYPEAHFSPMRLLDPAGHTWPAAGEQLAR
jgi:glycine/D-amino acid oxidase-like deaminating enzyme